MILEVTIGGYGRSTHAPENVHIATKWCPAMNLATKMHQKHIVMAGKATMYDKTDQKLHYSGVDIVQT